MDIKIFELYFLKMCSSSSLFGSFFVLFFLVLGLKRFLSFFIISSLFILTLIFLLNFLTVLTPN